MATVEQNRAASAMYAQQANQRYGTPIPGHLQGVTPSGGGGSTSSGKGALSGLISGLTGGYGGLLDMINGGGPGAAGEGRYTSLADMMNGGGAGRAGQTFQGGGLSALLNGLGIHPQGYNQRLAEARPMPRPATGGATAAPPSQTAPPNPYAPTAIQTDTLTPFNQMTDQQLVEYLRNALGQAPSATGYGPR